MVYPVYLGSRETRRRIRRARCCVDCERSALAVRSPL